MRVDGRMIREVLRAEAERVSPPPDLWERISRALARNRNRQGDRMQRAIAAFRQLLAVGVAAGLCWFLAVPARPALEPVVLAPGHWVGAFLPGQADRGGLGAGDLRWSSAEITLLR